MLFAAKWAQKKNSCTETHFTSCHPLGVKKGFIKGEALRLLRTNSSKENFQNRLEEFQKHLRERWYPRNLITLTLSEIHFENRKEALRQKPSREKTILPFVTQYQPSVPSLKNILMKHWQLIEKQPLLRQIYKEPPIISYKRGRSLKDKLVKAKLWYLKAKTRGWEAWVRLVNPYDISKISSKSRDITPKSPQVMESKTVWNSGFHAVDSGFQILDSRFFVNGSWEMDSRLQSTVDSGFLELYSFFQNPGFPIPQTRILLDSGFHKQNFLGFRNPDSLGWGEINLLQLVFSFVYLIFSSYFV